ncbi:DUF5926 family protein [Miniimonas arenae]|uniref:DUF5926 family protein n=1 Tax=Miniimonas arenae TaxID=676201 RepID=UPI001FECFA1F|nr:DUF5926 family protein [Miniimonas arenae]
MAKKNRRSSGPAQRAGGTRPGTRPASSRPDTHGAGADAGAATAPGAASAEATTRQRRTPVPFVARPFEGLAGEADWVAVREIVPSAVGTVRTTAEHGAVDVTIVSLLPDLMPAVRREDGQVLVALQTVGTSGDASRDVADALLRALELEPGDALTTNDLPEPGPRLQDVLDPAVPFEPEVRDEFDFWLAPGEHAHEVEAALENANELIVPTRPVAVPEELGKAFWCRMNGKEFLRWVVAAAEEETLDALARLAARRTAALEDGARLIGAFRTCGVLVPVWELVRGTEADELAEPVAALAERLGTALRTTDPLTSDERRARAGLVSRQVNLR